MSNKTITGKGRPTDRTEGNIGDIYIDSITDKRYKCAGSYEIVSDTTTSYYVWVPEATNTNPDDNTSSDPSTASSSAIIDVVELPTENINENVFYRLLKGSFVYNQFVQNAWICNTVDGLPEVGDPATADMVNVTAYYNTQNNTAYGYINDMLASAAGVPVGWYPLDVLGPAFNMTYRGIITDILEDPLDDTYRLLLEYVNHSYKNGKWIAHKTIGWAGAGRSAEIFNHPSNQATGNASHAEGYSSHAEGDHSHAEGYASHAEGNASHAEGNASHAEGGYSHAEGGYSHAEGYYSHAEGDYSHAEGYASHAEGPGKYIGCYITGNANTTVYNINDVSGIKLGSSIRYVTHEKDVPTYHTARIISIDSSNKTVTLNRTLSADNSLSNHYVNIYISGMALGTGSHVEGMRNIAAGRSQHVQGEFNEVDPEYDVNDNNKRGKYAHIVGNGTDDNNRSNAHTLDWDGNAWYAGSMECTSVVLASPNGTKFRVTVADDGTLTANPAT